ncbi:MAG: methylated-DNA--[protein]-cysteine S-methyltransferase [Alphaproteobacteria bacterium]|nr:methylated-DNA--[protein]-cysteine S-methyltransferase [Alphaproteobacteria bacterium]
MSTLDLSLDSPVGPLTVTQDGGALVALDWGARANGETSPLLAEAKRQLDAYFAGALDAFDLPVAPAGTAHQRKVWRAMQEIPFGGYQSYGALSAAIGSSPRAVGTACGRNPIPIIIPCHRVLAAGGGIGGYSGSGGTATKRYLLSLEGVALTS